jgi:hypothetical protein
VQAKVASDRTRLSGARPVNELRCGGDKPEMFTTVSGKSNVSAQGWLQGWEQGGKYM